MSCAGVAVRCTATRSSMQNRRQQYPALWDAAFNLPAIDNHCHPLLRKDKKDVKELEGIFSEADGGALKDSVYTAACFKATKDLAELLGLAEGATWEEVRKARMEWNYDDLCRLCFEKAKIEQVLIDDGIGGVKELAQPVADHRKLTARSPKRIVRVETVAEEVLIRVFKAWSGKIANPDDLGKDGEAMWSSFVGQFNDQLCEYVVDRKVVAFKSVVCYRSGLDVDPELRRDYQTFKAAFQEAYSQYDSSDTIRIANKALNDYVVRQTMLVAGYATKRLLPVQFHTGVGDNDLVLRRASPAHLQPLIKALPKVPIVLLHAGYPYTREAGYLASVYKQVYVDFGEVFPIVSAAGQRVILRELLEMAPTNKIMWSSDGHWWPETYYLGSRQAREALFSVLSEMVDKDELSETQAVGIVVRGLADTARQLYKLVT